VSGQALRSHDMGGGGQDDNERILLVVRFTIMRLWIEGLDPICGKKTHPGRLSSNILSLRPPRRGSVFYASK
jgi:hypothetical protein